MNGSHAEKANIKQRIAHEIRKLVAIFIYLAAFFIVLRFYTNLVRGETQINYLQYGLALLKSLALAKIILTGEALRLGERFRARPLIVPTLYKAVMFSTFALAFELGEHLVLGRVRGKELAEVWTEILDKGWPHLVAMALVVFVSFLPFFAFRETEHVVGEGAVYDLFFKRGATVEFGNVRKGGRES
jgi:hypothetical protein